MRKYKLIIGFLLIFFSFLYGCDSSHIKPAPVSEVPPESHSTITPTITLTPTSTPVQGTISIWHSLDEFDRSALLRSIASFQAENPQVHFDLLYIPPIDLLESYEKAAARGSGPALLIGPAQWSISLFEKGLIADLSDNIEQRYKHNLNPAALTSAIYQDSLIGIPYIISGVVLYRNNSIIREGPETFTDLISSAKGATDGDTIGAILERSFYFSGAHIEGLGGSLMDSDGNPAFNRDNYSDSLEWIDLLQSFAEAGPTSYYSDFDLDQFNQGKVAFIIDSTENMGSISDAIGENNLVIDKWPSYKHGHLSGFVHGTHIYLSSSMSSSVFGEGMGVHWMFIKYLLSCESQKYLISSGLIPASSSDYCDKGENDRLINQAMIALAGGSAYPVYPEFRELKNSMEIALQSVFNEEALPREALQKAYDDISLAISITRGTPTPNP